MGVLQVILAILLFGESILISTRRIPVTIPMVLCATIGLALMFLDAGLEKLL